MYYVLLEIKLKSIDWQIPLPGDLGLVKCLAVTATPPDKVANLLHFHLLQLIIFFYSKKKVEVSGAVTLKFLTIK